MGKPLPFKGQKVSYMWRYRHDDMGGGGTGEARFESNHTPTVAVGVHAKGQSIALKGLTVDEAFDLLFRQAVMPVAAAPTATMAIVGATTVKPGTYNLSLRFSLTPLRYTCDGATTTDNGAFSLASVTVAGQTFSIGSAIVNNQTVTLQGVVLSLDGGATAPRTVTATAAITYTRGTVVPRNNIGEDVDPAETGARATYSFSPSANLKVDLPLYYGWGGDSATPQSLTQLLSGTPADKTQSGNATRFWILVPHTHTAYASQRTLTAIGALPYPVTDQIVTHGTVTVDGHTYAAQYWTAASVAGVTLQLRPAY